MRASAVPQPEGYTIEHELGRGSMGVVYAATDRDTGARVALKVLRVEVYDDPMALTRFQREVDAAMRIEHPQIPRLYDAGELPDGRLFLAMELLEGSDFEAWLHEATRTQLEALTKLHSALPALAAAHDEAIVHRDLKPGNLFVTADSVKLLDFGIARDLVGSKARTATGVALGTPSYMSPEQASAPRSVDAATDIWAMGVMLYECLSGALPYDGESPHAVLIAVATGTHVPLRNAAPHVPAALAKEVERCLQRDPRKRPNARSLHERLGFLLADPPVREALQVRARDSDPDGAPLLLTPSPEAPARSGTRTVNTRGSRGRARAAWSLAALALVGLAGFAGWTVASDAPFAAPPSSAGEGTSRESAPAAESQASEARVGKAPPSRTRAAEEPPEPVAPPEPSEPVPDPRPSPMRASTRPSMRARSAPPPPLGEPEPELARAAGEPTTARAPAASDGHSSGAAQRASAQTSEASDRTTPADPERVPASSAGDSRDSANPTPASSPSAASSPSRAPPSPPQTHAMQAEPPPSDSMRSRTRPARMRPAPMREPPSRSAPMEPRGPGFVTF